MAEEALRIVKERPAEVIPLALRAMVRFPDVRRELDEGTARRPSELAYHKEFVELLRQERSRGRRLVLLTNSAGQVARRVAAELGLFAEVIDNSPGSGEALVARYGRGGFDVLAPPSARRWAQSVCREFHPWVPTAAEPMWKTWARALRANHWIKNFLVFIPVLAGQQFDRLDVVMRALVAFLAFSLIASSVYLVNDLLDLQEDRQHATKRNRPFAAGELHVAAAIPLVGVLILLGGGLAALLPRAFLMTLVGYLFLTLAYSVKLKGAVLIDVITLAALYTLRVIGGAAATGISPSVWLLGFSLFFFLSLAMVKRYAELHDRMGTPGWGAGERLPGRSYEPRDLPVLIAMGVGTGCVAVLVLALYVISDEFARHYRHPFLLWQLCPLVLYWIGRAWIVVARDEMHDDPVVWAVKDQLSRWTAVACVAVLVLAR